MLGQILKMKCSMNRFSFLILLSAMFVIVLSRVVWASVDSLLQPRDLGPIYCGIQKELKDERVEILAEGRLETLFFRSGMSRAQVSRSGFEKLIPDLLRGDFVQIKIHYYDQNHPEKNYEKDATPRIAVESMRQGSESHISYRTYFYPITEVSADRPDGCGFNFKYSLELDSMISVRCKTMGCSL